MSAFVTKFFLIALFFYRCSAGQVQTRYGPRYHLYPVQGWMNDPNGFCLFKGIYHLFFQHNPDSGLDPGIARWAHSTSHDLMHWEMQPIALPPDQYYDKHGAWSGSALIENDTMIIMYTGNVKDPAWQTQNLATSPDGVTFTKYPGNPVLDGEEYQPDIRDPKIWKHDDRYFMVLGARVDNRGQILLYSSQDLISWKKETPLYESDGSLGYMLECPDFFELNGKHVLLVSAQGMDPVGDSYRNLFQTGYIVGDFSYETLKFTPETPFIEMDHGHDVYASQTMLDESNDESRRICTGWMDMWETIYPQREEGWTGQMLIPRVFSLTEDNRLIQKPVEELYAARGRTLFAGKAQGGDTIELENKAGEIRIRGPKWQNFNLFIESTDVSVSISYDSQEHTVTLDRGGEDAVRRTKWEPKDELVMQILVDASSIELFCGEGEVTFSSRFFPPDEITVRLGDNVETVEMTVYEIQRTVEI